MCQSINTTGIQRKSKENHQQMCEFNILCVHKCTHKQINFYWSSKIVEDFFATIILELACINLYQNVKFDFYSALIHDLRRNIINTLG